MTKRSPNEFAFSKILLTSGIDPGSPESLLFVDLDDLNLEDAAVGDFIAAVAEVLHDKQEHAFMDSGWILKLSALMIAEQLLVRQREIQPARGSKLPVESFEEFCKLPAEALELTERDPSRVN
jgi:hypothetical protein